MGPPQESRAFILRTRAYGESDRIVSFLTEDAGKLTGIAKGARNSRRRFANCLNPFTLVRVHYRTRRAGGMVFMDSCDLLTLPGELADPMKFAYASYLIELVDFLTVEGQSVPEVFTLVDGALGRLREASATATFLRAFELRLLRHAGVEPRFDVCGRCARPLDAGGLYDPPSGSILCVNCRGEGVGLETHPATLAYLTNLQAVKPERRPVPAVDVTAEAATLLGHILALHLPRPLKSVAMIAALSE